MRCARGLCRGAGQRRGLFGSGEGGGEAASAVGGRQGRAISEWCRSVLEFTNQRGCLRTSGRQSAWRSRRPLTYSDSDSN